MSLINEALKKAQQNRSPSSPDSRRFAGGMAGGNSMQRDFALFKWIFGIVLMSTVFVALLFMLLAFWQRPRLFETTTPTAEEFTVTQTRPAAVPPTTPTEPAPPAPTVAPSAPPALNLQLPAPSVIAPLPFEQAPPPPLPQAEWKEEPPALPAAPVATTNEMEPEAPAPASPTEPSPPPPPEDTLPPPPPVEQAVVVDDEPPPPPPASNPAAIRTFLEESRISGIRMAGNDSRVLLNNRVHSIGSTVSAQLGLSIEAIQPNEIIFIDASGTRYRKTFP